MGGDCKSPGSAFEGSNPSPATIFNDQGISRYAHNFEGSKSVLNLLGIFRQDDYESNSESLLPLPAIHT